jgi:hypothetical protein
MSRGPAWFRAKKGRRDGPHAAVRNGLRDLGFFVADTAGSLEVLDLFTYDRGSNPWWIEVKRADGKGELTPAQVKFIAELERRGHSWAVVKSLDEALEALGADMRRAVERNAAATRARIDDEVRRLEAANE